MESRSGGWMDFRFSTAVCFFFQPASHHIVQFFSNFLTTNEPPPPLFIFGRRPRTKAARNLHAAMPAHLCVFPFSLAVGSSLSAGKPRSRAKFVFLSPCRVLQSRFSTTRSRSWQVYGYFPRRSRPDPRHEQIGATIKVETLGLYERLVDDEFFRRISLVEGRKKAQRHMPRFPLRVFTISLNTRVFVFAGQDLRASSFARVSMRPSQANGRRVQVKLNGLIRARPQIIPARLPAVPGDTVSHDIGIRWFCPAPISFPQIDALFVSPNKIAPPAFALLPTNEPL